MPGMLVYVDPERLAALRGEAGERWTIRRGDLLARDLLRPPDWTLYVATVREHRARVIAYLEHVAVDGDELGDAATCDVDITPILERLGCVGGIGGFSTWARSPRVLTRSDADLLRYRLGLPLDVDAPPPPEPPVAAIGFEHDAIAMQLLAAVYEDLASDATRMVLADRLLDLGDPRGEMMALQLARVHSGAPATPRERELIARHGHTWTKPLTGGLVFYGFRRGFLATAVVDDRAMMEPGWFEHPAWATVEELETRNPTLLLAPGLRSLRRVAIRGELLETLALHDRPLAIDTIVGGTVNTGDRPGRLVQGGVAIRQDDLQLLGRTTVLDRVRSMSLSLETPLLAHQAHRFLLTRLGMQLEHVELFSPDLTAVDPEPWILVHQRDLPLSLGFRGVVDDWLVVIVRQRGSIVVQLGDPSSAWQPDLQPILPAIASLGQGLDSITIEHVGEDRSGIDLGPAVEELRGMFPVVELSRAHRWRSP